LLTLEHPSRFVAITILFWELEIKVINFIAVDKLNYQVSQKGDFIAGTTNRSITIEGSQQQVIFDVWSVGLCIPINMSLIAIFNNDRWTLLMLKSWPASATTKRKMLTN
jgi:hypothetical protein